MKKLVCVAALLMMMIAPMAHAAEPVKILVNNRQIRTDAAPIVEKGRVLVPLRTVVESLHASITWDQKTKTATVRKWSESVRLTVGNKKALVQGKPDQSGELILDVPVRNVNNRLYIPLRFIAQQFGYQVSFSNNTVFINSPLSDKNRAILYKGDLAAARKLAMNMSAFDVHYQNAPFKVTIYGEDYSRTVLFPEGETLRFYSIYGNTISWIEIKDDFAVVVWQAHVESGKGYALQLFLEKQITDQQGTAPTINKTLIYHKFGFFGESTSEECGRIDTDGKITTLAVKESYGGKVLKESGTMTLELPGEKRVDAMN